MGQFKIGWLGWSGVVCSVWLIACALFPPYSFHPFCTYNLTYRLQATLEAEGKQYSSEVVYQRSRPRGALSTMFSNSCQSTHGTALAFRLDDSRLVLLPSHICQTADRTIADRSSRTYATDVARAMKQHRRVDVASICTGISRDRDRSMPYFLKYDGFLVDNADKPSQWIGFRFGDVSGPAAQFRLVSAIAEAADISPKDDLDKIAPGILKTEFKYVNWADSPERVISFSRRYSKSTYVAHQL